MTQQHQIVSLNGRRLSDVEIENFDMARESARQLKFQREALIIRGGQPDSEAAETHPSGAWPMAFHREGYRPSAEKYSLVWLIGNRVVLEEFSPAQGIDGRGWFRGLIDYDTETGELVRYVESDTTSLSRLATNPLEEVSTSNAPGVYLRYLEDALSEIALGKHSAFTNAPQQIAI